MSQLMFSIMYCQWEILNSFLNIFCAPLDNYKACQRLLTEIKWNFGVDNELQPWFSAGDNDSSMSKFNGGVAKQAHRALYLQCIQKYVLALCWSI